MSERRSGRKGLERHFLVTINDDNVDEEDTESIIFTLGSSLTNTNGAGNQFTLNITDDDDPVRYSFATTNTGNVPSASGTEDATPSFRIYLLDPVDQTLTREPGRTVTLNWTMDLTGGDDDDSEAADFTLPNDFGVGNTSTGTLTYSPRTSTSAAAEVYKELTTSDIAINSTDVTYETDESFSLAITSANANASAADHASTKTTHNFQTKTQKIIQKT